jgi:hypothetical protein
MDTALRTPTRDIADPEKASAPTQRRANMVDYSQRFLVIENYARRIMRVESPGDPGLF